MKDSVLKVLILEDNPYDAELNLKTLGKEFRSIDSRVAYDEKSFSTFLEDFNPDIVLSDYNLPVFNGLDALKISSERKPLTPFIIVTGSLDEETAVECIKQGAWDYVLKEHIIRLNTAVKAALELQLEISQRKIAEEKLIESQKLSSRLLDNIQIGVYLVNLESEVVFSNKKAEDITGFKPTEIIGKRVQDALNLLDSEGKPITDDTCPILKVKNTGVEQRDIICRFSTSSKEEKWLNVSATPDNVKDNNFSQVLICFQDVTDRLSMDRALLESETRYEAVFNSVSDAIFLYDPAEFRLVEVNDRVSALYGYSREEIKKLSISDFSAAEMGYTAALAIEFAKKVIKGEEQREEWLARHKDGRLFWTSVTLKLVNIGGEPFLMAIIADIDRQKRTETFLRESEEHYRALSENSPDVIMRFDRNGRHLFVNNAIYAQLGLKPEIFLNKSHHEMGIFDPEMCEFWEAAIVKVFKTEKSNEVEFSLPNNDGIILHYEWRLFPEFNQADQVTTVLAVARDISFRKVAQEALRISEERLQLALEATSDALWDFDIAKNSVYFSPRYANMLGYEPSEFPNELSTFENILHPDDYGPIVAYMQSALDQPVESVELSTRLRKKDGMYAWTHSRGKVFYSEGKPVRIVGTCVDITERKRQEEISQTIFDIGNAVVTTRNLDELFEKIQEILGRVIDTKNCYVALYDPKNDRISLPFHRDEKDSYVEFPAGKTLTAYVIRTGKVQLVSRERDIELSAAGEIETFGTPAVSWLGVPLRIGTEIFGVFTVQSYDERIMYSEEDVKILEFVSDQIALAISRKKDEDNIRENEQKLRRIIESSPDGLIVTNNEGIIIGYNTSIADLLRIEESELKDRSFLEFMNAADIEKIREIFSETIKSGYRKNNVFLIKREDGSEFYAELSLGLIQDPGNSAETFVINIKDITERIDYESNLRIAKERAVESDRLKTSFLSNMSHEIRTPLNAIVGFAELLAQNNLDENDKKEFISHINQGSETLLNLIDDIIDISKIEAAQIRINYTAFRLAPLLSDLEALFEKNIKRLSKENLKIINDNHGIDPDLTIVTDSFRLRQIFINLLSNSVKFTDEGTVSFGIKNIDRDLISFYVKDTGIGIPRDKHVLIFDRFRQGHESKTKFYGGTGLGLAISKSMTELMGGNIYVDSEPGSGSEFVFSIRFTKSDKKALKDEPKTQDQKPDWSNRTILVAEDENSNFIMIRDILKPTNVKVIWARDGLEVVKMFSENPDVDLVLMDVRLPYMNGYEATEEIKKLRKDVTVIAQTAYAMSGEREKSLAAGCDEYISKPIKPKDLITLVSKFLS
jgi:two-component system, sensor histidine kinase and response regulator